MKRNFFRKLVVMASVVAVGVLAPVIVAATNWSPERPTKVYNGPGTPGFDHVTFNSFTNVPDFGDERGFFTGKDAANTNAGGWTDTVKVRAGQEILLQTYVHNGADPSLNSAANGERGIARNTKVKVYVPTATAPGLRANSYVSASNANPGVVTDTADIQSENGTPVSLSYVAGSAKAYTNGVPSGMPIADSIVGDGAQIGYNQPDGNVPGCFQYVALVTIRVKVNAPSLSLTKEIAHPGQPWTKEVDSQPNETLSYLLTYKNDGTGVAHHVTVRDQMPPHADFVPGSARLYTDSTGPDGQQLNDTALFTTGGIDTSDYGPGAGGYIKFQVKLKNDFAPGHTRVQNVAYAHDTEMPNEIFDTAFFNVDTAQPTILTCKNLTVTLAPANGTLPNKPTFTGNAEKTGPGNLTPKTYEYKITKTQGDVVSPMPGSPVVDQNTAMTDTHAEAYTFTDPGTYRVSLSIVDQNGQRTAPVPACEQSFTLTAPNAPILTCKNLTVTLAPANATLPNKPTFIGNAEKTGTGNLTPKSYEYAVSKVNGDTVVPMPGSPVVDQNTAMTDTHAEAYTFTDPGTYRVSLSIVDQNGQRTAASPDCVQSFTLSTTPPPEDCITNPNMPICPHPLPPVPPVTPVTPVNPTSTPLPQTGVESGLAGMLGSTGLTFGALKYRRSKKAVGEALRKVK